jgi:hypothetical protein
VRKTTLYFEILSTFGIQDDIEVKKTSDPTCFTNALEVNVQREVRLAFHFLTTGVVITERNNEGIPKS